MRKHLAWPFTQEGYVNLLISKPNYASLVGDVAILTSSGFPNENH